VVVKSLREAATVVPHRHISQHITVFIADTIIYLERIPLNNKDMSMTRSQGRASRYWVVQVVNIVEPDITSAAALALLAKKYFGLDKSIYTDFRMQHLRTKWIRELMKTPDEAGGLTCAICQRKGLKSKTQVRDELATLDHIIEIGMGGAWNDPSNFQVACWDCNNARNSKNQKQKQTA